MKTLIINEKNKIVIYRNRHLRTPVVIENITDEEIKILLINFRMLNITDYEVIDNTFKKFKPQPIKQPIEIIKSNPEKIDEIKTNQTLLQKFMKESME